MVIQMACSCEHGNEISHFIKCGGWGGGVDWINLAQDRGKRKAVVNMVTNF